MKRYRHDGDCFEIEPDGEWVAYEDAQAAIDELEKSRVELVGDVDRVVAERDAARAEVERLKASRDKVVDLATTCANERDETQESLDYCQRQYRAFVERAEKAEAEVERLTRDLKTSQAMRENEMMEGMDLRSALADARKQRKGLAAALREILDDNSSHNMLEIFRVARVALRKYAPESKPEGGES